MKILITGGYGFFGFHLAKVLSQQNHEITLLDIKSKVDFDNAFRKLLTKDNVRYLEVNLLDNNLGKF